MLINRRTRNADPVVISRVIVNSLLSDMRESKGEYVEALSVLNVLRLLDIYEMDAFSVRKPLGVLQQDDFGDLNGRQGAENLARLKVALASTHQAFLPKASQSEFAQHIRGVLTSFVDRKPGTVAADVSEADRFLAELTKSLSVV